MRWKENQRHVRGTPSLGAAVSAALAPAVISRYKIWLMRWEGCGVSATSPSLCASQGRAQLALSPEPSSSQLAQRGCGALQNKPRFAS